MDPAVDITELYAAHRLSLVRLAVLLVDDVASAEDVVQDAFAALARRPDAVKDPSKALAYLRVAVVNTARSALRRRRTARAYAPPHDLSPPSPEDSAVLAEEHRAVIAACRPWPRASVRCWSLRYWSHLSEAEIARTLGISQGTVKSTASRALVALEKAMQTELGGGGAMSTPRRDAGHRGAAARRPDRARRAGAARGPGAACARSSRCDRAGSRPWVLLATAAVLLLVLGVVLQGVGRRPAVRRRRSEARRPDRSPRPADVGRDWQVSPESTPAKVDLDGDGTKETVEFLAEKTKDFDGRIRLQTTLTSTGKESYGSRTWRRRRRHDGGGARRRRRGRRPGAGPVRRTPRRPRRRSRSSSTCARDCWSRPCRRTPTCSGAATSRCPGARPSSTTGTASSSTGSTAAACSRDGRRTPSPRRDVDDAAAGGRARDLGVATRRRRRPAPGGRRLQGARLRRAGLRRRLGARSRTWAPPTGTVGVGESAASARSYPFAMRVEAGDPPLLVVEGSDGRTLRHELDVPDPRVATVQPDSTFSDGESLVVTSASDPTLVQLLVQRNDRIVVLEPVGEVPLENTGSNSHLAHQERIGGVGHRRRRRLLAAVVLADDVGRPGVRPPGRHGLLRRRRGPDHGARAAEVRTPC